MPQYSEEDLAQRGFPGVRPDVVGAYQPGAPLDKICPLLEQHRQVVLEQLLRMNMAAQADFAAYLKLGPADPAQAWLEGAGLLPEGGAKYAKVPWPDPRWIKAFDQHYKKDAIAALLERSKPQTHPDAAPSDYLITCIELTAALGETLIRITPGADWYCAWPYWDSSVYSPHSGKLAHVFDWALKKLSADACDEGLENKLWFGAQMLNEA
jgi:hypothetical protein